MIHQTVVIKQAASISCMNCMTVSWINKGWRHKLSMKGLDACAIIQVRKCSSGCSIFDHLSSWGASKEHHWLTMSCEFNSIVVCMQIVMTNDQRPLLSSTQSWGMAATSALEDGTVSGSIESKTASHLYVLIIERVTVGVNRLQSPDLMR